MKFSCEIDNIRTLKKGSKITLSLDDKQSKEVLKHMFNFMDKPIIVELFVDEKEQQERLKQISQEQRGKIYAIYKDIENFTGQNEESIKEQTKASFVKVTQYDDFSLANCSSELASDYIEYLIRLCFELGVPLSEPPREAFDDIERYISLSLEKRFCAVCGDTEGVEDHHWDAIGMGRNRKTYNDCALRKICLCYKHHKEAHNIGRDSFKDKYHVYGIEQA